MYSEIDEDFSLNQYDEESVRCCPRGTVVVLDGEIRTPSHEIAFVIYHFLSFMFSAFAVIMLLATGDFAWNLLSYIGLLSMSLFTDFPFLIMHSHVISDQLLLYRRNCYFRTNTVLHHLSWSTSFLAVPVIVLEAVYGTLSTIDIVFCSYFLVKILVGTVLIIAHHRGG